MSLSPNERMSRAFSESNTYFKNHSTYCAMKYLLCLKEVADEPSWQEKRSFFEKSIGDKGLHPHLSPDDYAEGAVSFLSVQMANMPDHLRKRAERKIRRNDMDTLGIDASIATAAPMATRRLKTAMAFSEHFPTHTRSANMVRRAKEQKHELLEEIMAHRDIRNPVLMNLYFGKGHHASFENVEKTLSDNQDIQRTLNSVMQSYDDYVNELALQSGMQPKQANHAIKQGHVSLWARVRNTVGHSVASVGKVARQAAAILAIGVLGASPMPMEKTADYDATFSSGPVNMHQSASTSPVDLPPLDHVDAPSSLSLSGGPGIDTPDAPATTLDAPSALSDIHHVVKAGDNAWDIAKSILEDVTEQSVSNQSVADYLTANGHSDRHHITPGSTLTFSLADIERHTPDTPSSSLSQR